MNFKKTLSAAVLCAGLMGFAACSGDHKDPKEMAEEMNDNKFDNDGEKAADKLVHAFSSNLYEIRASEEAAMNAATPEVKQLAGMLIAAHTKMNEEVKAMAATKDVTLPADLSDGQRRDLEKLGEKSGMDYDKEYTDQMKSKHEKAVDFYEKTADKCDDADIRTWASSTLPEVRSHLDMVKTTCESVKNK